MCHHVLWPQLEFLKKLDAGTLMEQLHCRFHPGMTAKRTIGNLWNATNLEEKKSLCSLSMWCGCNDDSVQTEIFHQLFYFVQIFISYRGWMLLTYFSLILSELAQYLLNRLVQLLSHDVLNWIWCSTNFSSCANMRFTHCILSGQQLDDLSQSLVPTFKLTLNFSLCLIC